MVPFYICPKECLTKYCEPLSKKKIVIQEMFGEGDG